MKEFSKQLGLHIKEIFQDPTLGAIHNIHNIAYNQVINEIDELKITLNEEKLAKFLCKMDENNKWEQCSIGLQNMFKRDAKKMIENLNEMIEIEKMVGRIK